MSKVAKGKRTTRGKNGKTGKCSVEQDNKPTDSFLNHNSRRFLMFLYQDWFMHEEKETSFLTLVWQVLV